MLASPPLGHEYSIDCQRKGQLMMLDWNAYPAELSARVKEMSLLAPNAVTGFMALDKGANKTTHLDAKTRELIAVAIAVAIAVTTRCESCIGVHTERAINAGATREEIAEALGVAIALNAGAALAYSARVLDAYATINDGAERPSSQDSYARAATALTAC
jgi:AhpD family alkylhydroperoxidase